MTEARPAAVAGLFYPGSAAELGQAVRFLLDEGSEARPDLLVKGVIAPHAGYVYSGSIAASAFRCFSADRERIRRIVLVGPAHRMRVEGLALTSWTSFETPLGSVPVDRALVESIVDHPLVSISDEAHAPEHSLEVELPFLQGILGQFSILPLLVSEISPPDMADILDRVWGGEETRFVVSSDLSHYMSYEHARDLDQETARQVLEMRGRIAPHRACGAVAIDGFLEAARRHRLTPRVLDLRNSGDTAGDRNRVVGYGSFAFVEPS